MRRYLLSALALTTSLAASMASGAPTSGGESGYQPQGKDYGYDNMRSDTTTTATHDEFAAGAALVKAQKFGEAIPHLELAQKKSPNNVTILIYLGFAHRMVAAGLAGDAQNAEYDKALSYYQMALAIDSHNKLLHEYLGKLRLLRREYALAANELTTLQTLCPSGCDELTALTQAVAANPPPPTAQKP
jgi:tetratricopeptide (TPR) repeat protein